MYPQQKYTYKYYGWPEPSHWLHTMLTMATVPV